MMRIQLMKFKLREARFDATSSQKYSSAKTAMANASTAVGQDLTTTAYSEKPKRKLYD